MSDNIGCGQARWNGTPKAEQDKILRVIDLRKKFKNFRTLEARRAKAKLEAEIKRKTRG
jgi:hypothetical protein